MRVSDFRRLALSLPEATEGSHFGNTDFRVGGKIFATLSLAKQGYGVLLLTPEQQKGMVEDEPEIFSPDSKCLGKKRSDSSEPGQCVAGHPESRTSDCVAKKSTQTAPVNVF